MNNNSFFKKINKLDILNIKKKKIINFKNGYL